MKRHLVVLVVAFCISVTQAADVIDKEEGIDDDLTPSVIKEGPANPANDKAAAHEASWVEQAALKKAKSHSAIAKRLEERGKDKTNNAGNNRLRGGISKIRQKEAQKKKKAGKKTAGKRSRDSFFDGLSPELLPEKEILIDLPNLGGPVARGHREKQKPQRKHYGFISNFLGSLFGQVSDEKSERVKVKRSTTNNTLVIDLPKMAGNLIQLYTQKELDFFFDPSPGEVRVAAFFVPQDHYDDKDETRDERKRERMEFRKTLMSLMMTAVDQRWVYNSEDWDEPSTLFLQNLRARVIKGQKFPFAFVQSRELAIKNGCPSKGWGHYCVVVIQKNLDGKGIGLGTRGFSASPTKRDLQQEIINIIVRSNRKWMNS